MLSSPPEPHPTRIDADMFPHILDTIIGLSPPASLLALRTTGRTMRSHIDALLAVHIVIKPCAAGYTVWSPRLRGRVPACCPPLPASAPAAGQPRWPDGWDVDAAPPVDRFTHTRVVDFMGRICLPPRSPLALALAHVDTVRCRSLPATPPSAASTPPSTPGRYSSAPHPGDLPVAIGVHPPTQITFATFASVPGSVPGAQVGLVACANRLVISLDCGEGESGEVEGGYVPRGQIEWFPHHVSLEEVVVIFRGRGGKATAAAATPAVETPIPVLAAELEPEAAMPGVFPTPPPTPAPATARPADRPPPLGILQNLVGMIAVHGQRIKHTLVGLETLDPAWLGLDTSAGSATSIHPIDPASNATITEETPTTTPPHPLVAIAKAIRTAIATVDISNNLLAGSDRRVAAAHRAKVLGNLEVLTRDEYAACVGEREWALESVDDCEAPPATVVARIDLSRCWPLVPFLQRGPRGMV